MNPVLRKEISKARCPDLKGAWASLVLARSSLAEGAGALALRSPFSQKDPLSEVLHYLVAKELGLVAPPLVAKLCPMPLFKLCQLALFWLIAEEVEKSHHLIDSIKPNIDLISLGCSEDEFDAKEALSTLFLLKTGELPPEEKSPYLLALFKKSAGLFEPIHSETKRVAGALNLVGRRAPLGALKMDSLEIPAFGPHLLPFSQPEGFGVSRAVQGNDAWTSFHAAPEVWLEAKLHWVESGCHIDVRYMGLKPDMKAAFVFYVRAESAEVAKQSLKPRSLSRYRGEASSVSFENRVKLESELPGQLEVIPLAGEGGFWNSSFLAAFEILPIHGKSSFKLELV
jgi:hypothetical protein